MDKTQEEKLESLINETFFEDNFKYYEFYKVISDKRILSQNGQRR